MAPKWKELKDRPQVPPRLPRDKGGVGTLGPVIRLVTNYFAAEFQTPDVTLYHYDIKIEDVWMSKEEMEKGAVGGAPAAAAVLPVGAPPQATGAKGKKKGKKGRYKQKAEGKEPEEGASAEAGTPAEKGTTSKSSDLKRNIPKPKRRKIFVKFIEELPKIFSNCPLAYDGEASAYSSKNPPQFKPKQPFNHSFLFSDESYSRPKKYKVTLELVNQEKLQTLFNSIRQAKAFPDNCQTIFQMLEIMFNYQRTIKFDTVGRNRFFSQTGSAFGQNYSVSLTKEGVVGFLSSLRPVAGWKDAGALWLNVDVAHTAYYKVQPLLNYLDGVGVRWDYNSNVDENIIQKIKREIVRPDIRIVSTHGPHKRKYKVTGVSRDTPVMHKFKHEDKLVTMLQYFKEKYKYNIRFQNMPCLMVGTSGSLMPMEVCEIAPNQRVKGKLSDVETAEFIKQTAVPPYERLRQVKNVMYQNNFSVDPCLRGMGVKISEMPMEIQGRVLPAPTVEVERKQIQPRQGVWDTRGSRFYASSNLTNWAFVYFTRYPERSQGDFINSIMHMGRERGMTVANPLEIGAGLPYNPGKSLHEIKRKHPSVNLIVCIIETSDTYKRIKEVGDRELMVTTQCILRKNVLKCSAPTVANILLKINAKLGGTNHISYYPPNFSSFAQLFNEPVMVLGADVNHPPASDRSTPSLVAVVGSTNRHATRYALEVRHQDHRKEMITDMEDIVKNLIEQFRVSTNCLPRRIFMFRDGVSETQFVQVLAEELRSIRAACTATKADYQPAITFLCVQKRHHTRLYCKDDRDSVGKSRNIPPGTVVDTTITNRTEADFFLCSHQGIQGTSRPSHYHVLWDDNDFTMDQLQLLTYSLCHNYARCNRAVSIPTPAYYAHLAAFRAKVHLQGYIDNNEDRASMAASSSRDGSYPYEDLKKATWVNREMHYPFMYYV